MAAFTAGNVVDPVAAAQGKRNLTATFGERQAAASVGIGDLRQVDKTAIIQRRPSMDARLRAVECFDRRIPFAGDASW